MSNDVFKTVLLDLSKKGLTYVDCAGLSLNDNQLDLLVTAMEHSLSNVRSINLSQNNITSNGVPFLLRFLENHQIDQLILHDNQIGETAALSFVSLYKGKRGCKLLDLRNNACTPMTAVRLFHLSRGDTYPHEIRQALLSGHASGLSFSNFALPDLDRDLLQYLLVEAENLKSVDFSSTDINATSMSVLGTVLKKSKLSSLCLRNCALTNDTVMLLVKTADLAHHPYLQHLNLSANMGLTNDLVRELITEVFDENSCITTCDLTETSITSQYRNYVQKNCELSKEHPAVKRAVVDLRNNAAGAADINLQWNGPLPTCMTYLAEPISQSSVIQRLNISNTQVGDDALEVLSQALQKNSSLKVLDLANCHFTVAGVKALFTVLSKGKCNVQEVNLANNDLGEDSVTCIVSALQVNPKLSVINVDVNPLISPASIQAVAGLTLINRVPPQMRVLLPSLEGNSPAVVMADFSAKDVIVNDDAVWILSQALRTNTKVQRLNLAHNSIGERGATFIAALLQSNKTIANVDLSNNCIGNRGAHALCEALIENTGVQTLNLSNNVMSVDGVVTLPTVLRSNHILREVKLERTRVPEAFVASVQMACSLNRECAALKAIYYSLLDNDASVTRVELHNMSNEQSIDDQSMQTLCQVLRGKAFVQDINFSNHSIGASGCAALAIVLAESTCNVRKLILSSGPIDDLGAAELAKSFAFNQQLQFLDLCSTRVTNVGAELLARGLENNSMLCTISLSDHVHGKGMALLKRNLALNIGPKAVKEVILRLDSGSAMESVALSQLPDGELDDELCQILCASFVSNKALHSLNLSHNHITTASVPYLLEVVESCPSLAHLDISDNRIDERGGKEIIACMERVAHLRSIHLTGNPIEHETQRHASELVAMNLGSAKLKQLLLAKSYGELLDEEINLNGDANSYKLNDDELVVLANVLHTCGEVKSLDLGGNQFTDSGCVVLAEALRVSHTLEALNLAGNNIGTEAGEALFLALRLNPHLQCLNLDGCAIPRDVMEDIFSLLHVNQTRYCKKPNARSIATGSAANNPAICAADQQSGAVPSVAQA